MSTELLSLLACPACRVNGLADEPRTLRCLTCDAAYPIEDGIPVLLVGGASQDARRQARHFDEEVDHEFEIARPNGAPPLYRWLMAEKFRRSVASLRPLLGGATAVTVCGGSGMDAEFLARAGARVLASDISLGAARRTRERARRTGLPITPVVADVERLPFRDRSADLVYVHDGLHHLERPEAGLAEMARVAARAVSLTEPSEAALTSAAVRLGLAFEREDAGNRVARLSLSEVSSELESFGFRVLRAERYGMYYRHEPGRAVSALSREPLLALSRFALRAANLVLARLGNKLTVQAVREEAP